MTIGEKIYQLRKKAGISQEELARQVKVSRQAVSKWERDESPPDAEKIVVISSIFSVSTDYLLIDGIEGHENAEHAYLPQMQAAKARRKKKWGGVCLAIGIPLGAFSSLVLYAWNVLMTSPDVAPLPDFLMPVGIFMGITIGVFLVLSLFLIGFGSYRLVAYRKETSNLPRGSHRWSSM